LAAVNFTLDLIVGGGTTTGPSVNPGDSITLTVTCAGAVSGTSQATPSNQSGCTAVFVVVDVPKANAITTFSGSTYSVTYSFTAGGTLTYFRTITGSILTPSYSVTAPTSINEGSAGTINVSTENVANTTLYWTVEPTGDFATSSGSFSLTSGSGSFTVTPTADSTTEGAETGTIRIRTGSTAGPEVAYDTFTINDTSLTPTYSVTAPTSINEGSAGSFTVSTTNVANTTLYWTVEPTSDFATSSGSFSLTSGSGSFTVTPTADLTTEGAETGTIRIRTGSTAGPQVAYDNFTINDTSTTPIIAPDLVVVASSSTIAYDATSASTTVTGCQAVEYYAVRVNNGTTNLATATGSTTNTITFSTSLPAAGTTATYEIFAMRPTNQGGDGLYYATNDTFTVTRTAGPTYSVTAPTSINEGSAGSMSVATTNVADSTTLYWTVTPAGDFGTSSGSFTITSNAGSFTVTPTADSTTEGAENGTIQIRTGSTAGPQVAYANFTINDTSTTPITTPTQFTFTDVPNAALTTPQISNLITIGGMSSGVTATVTVSGGTYSKNGGAYTSATGTAVNGDTFRVQHTSSASYATAVNTTLTVNGVFDTFTSTTADFAGATYYVDTTVSYDQELNQMSVFISGTGVGNPKLLNPGDRVGFKQITSTSVGNSSVSLFSADHWTSTSVLTLTNSYQYKYASSTIPVDVVDTVNYIAYRSGATNSTTKTSSFMGQSLQPDTTVTLDESTYVITSTATSHTIVITNAGTTQNGTITVYRVKDSNTTHESRTGYGSLTITDVPPNDGFPKTYTLEARVTTADGGSGLWTGITTYDVIAITTADQNDPTISTYGFAIYDHEGTAITSFNEGHSTLRDLFTSPVTALSTTGTTDISTGLSGITTSNCVIIVEGVSSTGAEIAVEIPATFVGTNPVSVRLGRAYSAMSVKVTVSQYVGLTIGATADAYGFQLINGANNAVIDQNSVVYGVKEIIALDPTLSTQVLYQNDHTYFMYIQLVQGRYPASGGLPIPAISSSKSVYLIPPTLSNAKWPDGSYKEVVVYIPKAGAITGYYNLAMLVASNTATPSYYGGSAPTHGAQVFSATGALIWDSAWRQAVVNNVISANQFTTGVTQNGTWDVTSGYDGVTAPTTGDTFPYPEFIVNTMRSIGASRTSTGLNDMDPANTYLAGSSLSGNVRYHMGFWRDLEQGTEGYGGGGKHKLAAKVNSFTSATITMFRYDDGPLPSTEADRITRVSTSRHPEGNFIFFRIV